MHRRHLLAGLAATNALPAVAHAAGGNTGPSPEDIDWLVDQLGRHYAYLPDRHIDLARLRQIYRGEALVAQGPQASLAALERCLAELHDHHVGPNTNNDYSPQLVPTGTEIWAGFQNGRALIETVRPGSAAVRAGVRAGDEVVRLDGVPIREAVAAHAPRCLAAPDPEADDYTLRVLLAGTHKALRVIGLRDGREIALAPYQRDPDGPTLTTRVLESGIAYIRIENSLGDSDLVPAFDAALAAHRDAKGLILDLRNTPSGGDTDVAEPILGRFINLLQGYQRGFKPGPGRTLARDGWVKIVPPRGPFTAAMPLVVLVDRWTGSMGEGMAIGLDGMKRATVVGTRMAGLCGSIEGFKLPHCGIGVNFATERLYHLDGTPREKWGPPVLVDLASATGEDPILARGLAVLRG
jgi:C-terminal processing protease CtpA/Prc